MQIICNNKTTVDKFKAFTRSNLGDFTNVEVWYVFILHSLSACICIDVLQSESCVSRHESESDSRRTRTHEENTYMHYMKFDFKTDYNRWRDHCAEFNPKTLVLIRVSACSAHGTEQDSKANWNG